MSDLLQQVDSQLREHGTGPHSFEVVLDLLLAHFECALGTVHKLDNSTGLLTMVAHRNMPQALMNRVSVIPIGKGMAGLAAERREAVQVCNLQTDDSGTAKPAAKITGMEGSISFPMIHKGTVVGTMGVAKPTVAEYPEEDVSLLLKVGEIAARHLNAEASSQ